MNYFSYKKALIRLNRNRDTESKALSKSIEEAKRTGGLEKAREVYQSESFELDMINEEIAVLKTRYLRYRAEKKSLPIPQMNDKDGLWETGHYTGRWYLTNKGITELLSLIRKDRKERMEIFSYWVAILFGLIGAITGLIAVIKR